MLLVLSGPSGVGKGTLAARLVAREPGWWQSVSCTTRAPRPGEVEGVHYHFVGRAQFEAQRAAGGFLESFAVFDDLYGTPRAPVEEHLAAGDDVLLEIDVQGALAVRDAFPDAVLVFVRAPSHEELRRRLVGRRRGPADDLDARLAAAAEEEARAPEFDAVVVNDDVDAAVGRLAGILAGRRPAS